MAKEISSASDVPGLERYRLEMLAAAVVVLASAGAEMGF
jgi:hypothetical protein